MSNELKNHMIGIPIFDITNLNSSDNSLFGG